jgi:hypothetical protein
MKFDDIFEDAVREAFSSYGLVGPVMIKDIESRTGMKVSKWWKKPEKIEQVILYTYGQGGRAITSNILQKLLDRLPEYHQHIGDDSFPDAIRRIADLERRKK